MGLLQSSIQCNPTIQPTISLRTEFPRGTNVAPPALPLEHTADGRTGLAATVAAAAVSPAAFADSSLQHDKHSLGRSCAANRSHCRPHYLHKPALVGLHHAMHTIHARALDGNTIQPTATWTEVSLQVVMRAGTNGTHQPCQLACVRLPWQPRPSALGPPSGLVPHPASHGIRQAPGHAGRQLAGHLADARPTTQ